MSFESIRQPGMRSPYGDSWFFPLAVKKTGNMAVCRKNWTLVCQWGERLNAKGQVHGNKPGFGVLAKEETYKFRISGHGE